MPVSGLAQKHTRSWAKGDSITWGGSRDDFLWDLLLGLELFLRGPRAHFCRGEGGRGRHLLTLPCKVPTSPHQAAGPAILPQTFTLVVIVVCVVWK